MHDSQKGLWEPDDPTSLPSGTERFLTEQVLTNLSTELAILLLSIQENERLLQEQRSKATALEREIARRRFFLAPVRRLPLDVLGNIVVMLSREYGPRKDVWIFSWVCRAWRSAAMTRPSAWSRITISLPRRRDPVELAKAASRYSRGSDIDLHVDSRLSKLDALALLSILRCRPKRVTSLYLTLRDIPRDALKSLRPYPNIRRIYLSVFYEDQTRILDRLVPRRHRRQASTKTFELYLDRIEFTTGAYPRLFSKLCVLNLVGCYVPALGEFVTAISRSSVTLESLSVCECEWDSALPCTRLVDFPALRKLRWIPKDPELGGHVLHYIRVPHLACYTGMLSAEYLARGFPTPNVGTLGLFIDRWVPASNDFQHLVLEQSLSRCHTLTLYAFFIRSGDLEQLLALISLHPQMLGSSFVHLNIAYCGPALPYGLRKHLEALRVGLEMTGRRIEVAFYDWTPNPMDQRPWGMCGIYNRRPLLICFADLEELTPMRYSS
jgi:hypothetical protein